ncbi:hypothetical protein CEP54_010601 [Fusarium duplospermum]|uniref:Uncharacterized protein n=1 Tax=Fusarium duplospermum TaxID=1325734 RepID=A0A428PJ67_9HYPO|nr:hypothetical protein CEP54_010601 [Fusarium duplospermum]
MDFRASRPWSNLSAGADLPGDGPFQRSSGLISRPPPGDVISNCLGRGPGASQPVLVSPVRQRQNRSTLSPGSSFPHAHPLPKCSTPPQPSQPDSGRLCPLPRSHNSSSPSFQPTPSVPSSSSAPQVEPWKTTAHKTRRLPPTPWMVIPF